MTTKTDPDHLTVGPREELGGMTAAEVLCKFTGMTPAEFVADLERFQASRRADPLAQPEEELPVEIPTEVLCFDATLMVECSKSLDDVYGFRLLVHDKDPKAVRLLGGMGEGVMGELSGDPIAVAAGEGNRGRTWWDIDGYTMSLEVSEATGDRLLFELDLGV